MLTSIVPGTDNEPVEVVPVDLTFSGSVQLHGAGPLAGT